MPSGCPSAMAPPLGFTRGSSSARPSRRGQASAWAANASLSSMTLISSSRSRARARAFPVAGTGPIPMMRGSTPAAATATTRALGVRPSSSTALSDATSSAHAPSLSPLEFPAVTDPLPSPRNAGLSLARISGVVSGRMPSSSQKIASGPPAPRNDSFATPLSSRGRAAPVAIPTISLANLPRARAARRKPPHQEPHPRDVAVVLPGLVGAAHHHVGDPGGVEPRMPLEKLRDGVGGEVVGADARERVAEAPDRSADAVDEKRVGHERAARGRGGLTPGAVLI